MQRAHNIVAARRASPERYTAAMSASPPSRRSLLLATGLLSLAIPLLLAGSVLSWQRGVMHLCLMLPLAVSLFLPSDVLERQGTTLRLLAIGAAVLAVAAVGLLPLPHGLLAPLAPGRAAALPSASWATLSMNPEATLSSLFTGFAALGIAASASIGTSQRGGRQATGLAAAGLLAGLLAIGIGHVATDAVAIFGLLHPDYTPTPFWAPLVNHNHFAALIVLLLPITAWEAWQQRDSMLGLPLAAVVATALGCLVALASGAATLGLLVGSLATAIALGPHSRRVALPLGAVSLLALVAGTLWTVLGDSAWHRASVFQRAEQWADQPALIAAHWATGSGIGAYSEAYGPFNTQLDGLLYRHAHSEFLTWLVATGLLGLVALVLAAMLLPRAARSRRGRAWQIGLIALAAQCLVSAPLHVPAVLLIASAVLGLRVGGYAKRRESRPRTVRLVLITLLAANLLGALWSAREHVADAASRQALAVQREPAAAREAADRLAWLAPWRFAHHYVDAVQLSDPTARAEAARSLVVDYADNSEALLRSGALLAEAGAIDEAREALVRASERNRSDYRPYLTLARLLRPTDPEAAATAWATGLHYRPFDNDNGPALLAEGYQSFPVAPWWADHLEDAHVSWMIELARLLQREGEPASALLLYEQLGTQRDELAWLPERARTLDALGDPAGARRFLDEAEPHNREHVGYYLTRGDLLVRWGEPELAIEAFLRANALRPEREDTAVRAVRTAATLSDERAIELSQRLARTGRLPARAAVIGAHAAHRRQRFSTCVELLEDGDVIRSDLAVEARPLWAACAAECEDCDVVPD